MIKEKATSSTSAFKMETAITMNIKAKPEKLMSLLTNAGDFIKWNSTVTSLEGQIRQGETIRLKSVLDPKRTFKLKITQLGPLTMTWKDGFAPMFKGVRTFTLTAKPDGSTDFTMAEVFRGIMLPLIKGSLPDFKPNFEQYAADLKRAAEKNM